MMYYYKRKSNPFKWVIIILIFMALGALVYWFYFNYFSRIDLGGPVNENNLNIVEPDNPKIINGEISQLQGDVQVNIGQKGFEKAIDKAVLHQGDAIKTGSNSLAVLALADDTQIRLGADTELILENLAENDILIDLLNGRIYNNIAGEGRYQIKSLGTLITSLGTIFDILSNNESQTVTVSVLENNLNLEIFKDNELVMSSRLDTNEKGTVDLKASKQDLFKIETIDPKILAKNQWYKWNFDLDQSVPDDLVPEDLPEQEDPDFMEVSDSLKLSAKETAQGINLAWTIYNADNFQSYKIMWSDSNLNLKYPGGEVVTSISDKTILQYLDTKIEPNQKYYYRICAVKTGNKVACGNVAQIQTEVKDSAPPTAPSLSATIDVPGVSLTWTKNTEEDFKEYRILKSITDSNPSFPTAGYLVKKYSGQESFLDTEVNITYPFNAYYRVCSFDNALNYSCSNVITVEQGKIK